MKQTKMSTMKTAQPAVEILLLLVGTPQKLQNGQRQPCCGAIGAGP